MTWTALPRTARALCVLYALNAAAALAGARPFQDASPSQDDARPLTERVTHGYVENGDVRLHYASLGEGPLVVMLHGFPDYWYTWRHQMEALAADHRVVALDLRGYNLSDKPQGVANYAMPVLLSDVAAVIDHCESERAVVVGHDWGGAIAWNFAIWYPQKVERLIVLNIPHPNALARELRSNPQQQENSAYAHRFQQEGAHTALTAAGLASWVGEDVRGAYIEAFERSDFEAMLNYYKANFPRPEAEESSAPRVEPPKVRAPVLQVHGLADRALLASGLSGTWDWIDNDYTLVTIPGAGHFVQQDAPELVTDSIMMWLHR